MAVGLLPLLASAQLGINARWSTVPQEISMKRIVVTISALLMAVGLMPATAHAVTLTTQTFCVAASDPAGESASCPDGLGATLTLDLVNLADNTYTMTVTLDTTSALFPADL